MKIEFLDKIYILHYDKHEERREYLEKRIEELGLKDYVVWLVSGKEGKFTKKELSLHDGGDEAIAERKRYLGENVLTPGKIDMIMMLQHIQVLKKVIRKKNNKVSLIFENDVLLDDNFPEKLDYAIKLLNEIQWDICYSDRGSLLVIPKLKRKKDELVSLYEVPDKRSNTTGSYLVNYDGAKKLLKLMKKIAFGPDMELTYVQRKNNLKVYWTIPFLTHQGSIEEFYKSEVRKGSIAGKVIKVMNKVERVSPYLAELIGRTADLLMKITYKSKILIYIKNRIKKII